MSASQLEEWLAYDVIEPFGEYRQELRNGKLMAQQANLKRDPKKKPQPFTPLEFMDFIDKPEEQQESPEVLSAQLTAMFDTIGKANG